MNNMARKFGKHELKKMTKDVELVRKTAVVVIEMDQENNATIYENCADFNSRLGGTIAVIGPGKTGDVSLNRAVLLEVGIGPSRPYKQGWISDEIGKRWFPERKKCFEISREQYLICAPIIFSYMQKITNDRVSKWKCNLQNPFYIKGTKNYWSHRGKKMYVNEKARIVIPAARFSVAVHDDFILSDVFWLEFKGARESLDGLARFIDKRLRRNRKENYVDFPKLKAAEDIKKALARLPFYLKVEMLESFFGHRTDRNKIYNDLAELVDWDFEMTKEKQMANKALPDYRNRTNDIKIKIIDSFRDNKDYVVFEVAAKNDAY